MNYNPPGATSVTGNLDLVYSLKDSSELRAQVKRVLQLAETVCPDEFQAYMRLVEPYRKMLGKWSERGLLDDQEAYRIELVERIRYYVSVRQKFEVLVNERSTPLRSNTGAPYNGELMDEMAMHRAEDA
ncbi:hypothetical protein RhiJN_10501 [Ceratobasidium sp. AG-Ba]|nr:hypothetical protein RhiJN_10501 [Ceratobasidium sp. AG-Ba]QRW11234.1 hypothetical protein RhiLY_10233 [Ceratobasidium sp. AG-Ba]